MGELIGLTRVLVRDQREGSLHSKATPEVVELHRITEPIPGRPGWRRDPLTRSEWYCAEWLSWTEVTR
jgi:hypothetical protein